MPAPSDPLLAKAAELRAAGLAWEAVARQLDRNPETVRRWTVTHALRWRRLLRAAEDQLLAEATAESVHTLRKQLRSEDEKAGRDAADKLIKFRVAARKTAGRKKAAGPRASAAAVRTAAYVEGLSDEQLDHLLAHLWDLRHARLAPAGRVDAPAPAVLPGSPG